MVTFTIPAELRSLCRKHPKELYDQMLKQSAQALKDIALTKTGGITGFTSVLHTWGRQLQHHPHLHCIVPAAAFDPKAGQIKLPNKDDFMVHFRPLAQRFRNLMRLGLQLEHPEINHHLSNDQRICFSAKTVWNVQLQHVGRGKTAIRYLAHYVKRSGFTNKRLIGYTADKKHVLLRWINSANGKAGVLKLSVYEFIRRWLLHVLPKGFSRVRHYGYLSSAAKKTRLLVRALLGEIGEPEIEFPELKPLCCPHCEGKLEFIREIAHINPHRGPPQRVA